MKLRERFSNAKEFLTEGNGLYLIQQLPLVGDYYTAREFSKHWRNEIDNKKTCALFGIGFGALRLMTIGVGIAVGKPETGLLGNGLIGGVTSYNTFDSRLENGYYDKVRSVLTK
jgi:hypothetical protein